MALLDVGLGVFEFELRLIFSLLKLQESLHAAQLLFNSGRVSREDVKIGQRNKDLTALKYELAHDFKSGSLYRLMWGNIQEQSAVVLQKKPR